MRLGRLGLVTTSYPRFAGDVAGLFVEQHVGYLTRAGWSVEVLAQGAQSHSGLGIHGERITRIPAAKGLFDSGGGPDALEASRRNWLGAARFSWRLARELHRRQNHWSAVVCHWLAPSAMAALWRAPTLPMLAIAHSGDVYALRRAGLLKGLTVAMTRHRAPVCVSFVNQGLADLFLQSAPRFLGDRVAQLCQVCPMGIDAAAFSGNERSDRAPMKVTFLGRLVDIKGVDQLVESTAQWTFSAHLTIAGDGPQKLALQQLARRSGDRAVDFVGPVYGADRDRLLKSSDMVVLPSRRLANGRREGMPVVALEAMAAGAALIASRHGGLGELPEQVVTKLDGDSPGHIARAINGLAADPDRRERQAQAGREFARRYDWSLVGPRLLPPDEPNFQVA